MALSALRSWKEEETEEIKQELFSMISCHWEEIDFSIMRVVL